MKKTRYRITLETGEEVEAQEIKGQDIFKGKVFHKGMNRFFWEKDIKNIAKL